MKFYSTSDKLQSSVVYTIAGRAVPLWRAQRWHLDFAQVHGPSMETWTTPYPWSGKGLKTPITSHRSMMAFWKPKNLIQYVATAQCYWENQLPQPEATDAWTLNPNRSMIRLTNTAPGDNLFYIFRQPWTFVNTDLPTSCHLLLLFLVMGFTILCQRLATSISPFEHTLIF